MVYLSSRVNFELDNFRFFLNFHYYHHYYFSFYFLSLNYYLNLNFSVLKILADVPKSVARF